MTFVTTELEDGGFLVEGTDSRGTDGSQVLYSGSWSDVLAKRAHFKASTEFNAAVEEFFKPLTDAAQAAKAASGPGLRKYTITEGVNGVKDETILLDREGVLLRMLEEGLHDQLRWVHDKLVAYKA